MRTKASRAAEETTPLNGALMRFSILTLAENTVYRRGLTAEHGLSLLIRTDEGEVLFDTGPGSAAVSNAAKMQVDLRKVSGIVLSHGHYDHTGGLRQILETIGPRPVFAHPSVFAPKYSTKRGGLRSVGMPETRSQLERAGADFRFSETPTEVLPGVISTGSIPRLSGFEEVGTHFLTSTEEGAALSHDMLWDDQALVLDNRSAPVVVLGCGHSGLVNTLLYAAELMGRKRFALVIGGTHLIDATEACLERTLEALDQFDISKIAPCHCTGLRGQVALWEKFRGRLIWNSTGDQIGCEMLEPQ